jgi:hypothetical protein
MPTLPAAGAVKRKAVLLGLMLVLAGVGTWWKLSHTSGSASLVATPETSAPLQTQAAPAGPVAADLVETSTARNDAAHLSEAERLRLSLERLEREDRAHTAALAQQRAAMVAEQQRRVELARRRAEAAAAATAAAEASPAPTPTASPQPTTAARAVAKTEVTALPAASAATVELACADSSNFFTRDLCRLRECGKPAFARDPTCVRFREMEEANRRAQSNN